jgi:xanthine/CO dehydrogenase XdhC/CoxF family maturation factor
MVVTYDTTDDDDAKVGIGLGCNGIIHILIEPILPEKLNNPLELLLQAKSIRQKAVLATLYSLKNKKALQPGTCILYASGKITGSLDVSLLDQDVTGEMQKAYDLTQSRLKEFRQLTGFIQVLQPTLRLVIFGAGNDVIPLTEMAAVLGWETVVIDGRATHAKAERFPLSSGVIVAKPGAAVTLVESDEQTYFLLMTHNYNYDLEIFKSLVLQDVKYIGVLGPKKKLQQMVEEAGSSDMSNVYGPVGLDIGAETAEEIALSIISEIKAVSSASEGGSLRNKPEPIHSFSTLFSS